jgi:hypothetical protein
MSVLAMPIEEGDVSDEDLDAYGLEIIVDYECVSARLLGSSNKDMSGKCSKLCYRKNLYSRDSRFKVRTNTYCTGTVINNDYANQKAPYITVDMGNDTQTLNEFKDTTNLNLLGMDVDRSMLLLVRRIMLGIFGIAGLVDVAMGIWATYKYSLSNGNQEKIQESVKIFKSLVIGTIVIFAGVSLIQVASMLTGLTGALLDFDFVPRSGRVVFLYKEDAGRKCFIEQIPDSAGEQLTCNPETFIWE